MEPERIHQIPLDEIVAHPGNRRVGGFDKAKLEQLAESIRAVGVQQPAVVRKASENGRYELVAGERRWRAAKLAGLVALPCVVRELDDIQVLKIRTIENLQREDIHPLDEAEGYARLIAIAKYDVETVAAETGKSASYVYQRLKLRDLIPEARKLLLEGHINAGHAILIARLMPENQKDVADWVKLPDRIERDAPSVRHLAAYIEQEIYMSLPKASFRKDDETLVPPAGPCTTCQKRTGYQPALFADVGKHDQCLDRVCFNAKLDALVARKAEELKGAGMARVHGRAGSYNEEQRDPKARKYYEFEPAKKGAEGAIPLLVTTGPDRGQVQYGKERRRGSAYGGVTEADKKREHDRKAKEKDRDRQRASLVEQILAHVRKQAEKTGHLPADILLLMARRGTLRLWGEQLERIAEAMGWEKGAAATIRKQAAKIPAPAVLPFLVVCTLAEIQGPVYYGKDELAELARRRKIKPAPKPEAKVGPAPKPRRTKKSGA